MQKIEKQIQVTGAEAQNIIKVTGLYYLASLAIYALLIAVLLILAISPIFTCEILDETKSFSLLDNQILFFDKLDTIEEMQQYTRVADCYILNALNLCFLGMLFLTAFIFAILLFSSLKKTFSSLFGGLFSAKKVFTFTSKVNVSPTGFLINNTFPLMIIYTVLVALIPILYPIVGKSDACDFLYFAHLSGLNLVWLILLIVCLATIYIISRVLKNVATNLTANIQQL